MAVEGGWREGLFEKGAKYRVLKTWSQQGSTFTEGTIVKFERAGYERYDCMSLFRFYEKSGLFSGKKLLVWFIHDDEPDSKAKEYFTKYES